MNERRKTEADFTRVFGRWFGDGLWYKISDMSVGVKPFDGFYFGASRFGITAAAVELKACPLAGGRIRLAAVSEGQREALARCGSYGFVAFGWRMVGGWCGCLIAFEDYMRAYENGVKSVNWLEGQKLARVSFYVLASGLVLEQHKKRLGGAFHACEGVS